MTNRPPNRLSQETSPYLLQHQYNPVDWYPWGEEAFEKARKENKPLLISIGYSACHWCHVMERECFENEEIAQIINETVIPVKVDREERPDVDAIYMNACMAMTGHGGWPLNAFVTPDLKPFFVGTYFPPENRSGHPGFPTVLNKIREAWVLESGSLRQQAQMLYDQISQAENISLNNNDLQLDIERKFIGQSASTFDVRYAGFGGAPKFPPDTRLALLLASGVRLKSDSALNMAYLTLRAMARGGMYDQLAGGFYRYSVDAQWLIPHFEKMLYNQALLIPVYLDAYLISSESEFLACARTTADWVLNDLRSKDGLFYSAYDADSEGEEGKYYVWKPDEIERILGEEDGRLFNSVYGISSEGNFEHGTSNPALQRSFEEKLTDADFPAKLNDLKAKLRAEREKRVAPGLDDKCVLSWNALMISALCRLNQITGEANYLHAAEKAMAVIREEFFDGNELKRVSGKGKIYGRGVLEDYAFLSDALIDLYETSFQRDNLELAEVLLEKIVKDFSDNAGAGFFYTDGKDQSLISRTRDDHDGALPGSSSIAVKALYRAGSLLRNEGFIARADKAVKSVAERANQFPSAFASLILATHYKPSTATEISVVGKNREEVSDLIDALHRSYKPGKVISLSTNDSLHSVPMNVEYPTHSNSVFVCRNTVCLPPVATADELKALLAKD